MRQPLIRGGLVLSVSVLAASALADTLYLRSGDRVEGVLVGVSGNSIEFEEMDRGRARVRRFDRDDVRRIEIDDRGGSSGSNSGGTWGGSGNTGGSGNAGGTAGMRERTITVDAARPWTDTGIELKRGQEIRFRATGKVRWGPNRSDGPGGEGGNHYNAARPLPDRPAASLIGRLGDRDDVFFIGNDEGSIRARDGGRLHLGINDDYMQDNSGSFRVTVYY